MMPVNGQRRLCQRGDDIGGNRRITRETHHRHGRYSPHIAALCDINSPPIGEFRPLSAQYAAARHRPAAGILMD
jgi:hypothetical protein